MSWVLKAWEGEGKELHYPEPVPPQNNARSEPWLLCGFPQLYLLGYKQSLGEHRQILKSHDITLILPQK